MKDNHHGTLILHDFKDLFMQKESAQTRQSKEKKKQEYKFNEVRLLLTSSGQKGRQILLNQSSTKYNYWG